MGETNGKSPRDWKELAKAASKETDPQKLAKLVEELNQSLKIKLSVREQYQEKKSA